MWSFVPSFHGCQNTTNKSLFPHHMGLRNQSQIYRLGGKGFNLKKIIKINDFTTKTKNVVEIH